MTKPPPVPRNPARSRLVLVLAAVAVGIGAGFAGVYGIGTVTRNAGGDAACRSAVDTARTIAPLARGEVAAVTVARTGLKLPDLRFHDGDGTPRTLADWNGRTVLLNLWATWCAPCREEMPALADLQTKLGSPEFEVVTVNIDTRDPDKPRAWLQEVGIGPDRLAYYADPSGRVFQELKRAGKAFGMPTTLLIDPQGCEIANLAGPAEWASDDAIALVSAALGARNGSK